MVVVIRNLLKDLNYKYHDSGRMQTLMLTKSILLSAQRVGDAVSTAAVIRQRFAGPIKSGKLFQSMKVMHMIQVTNTLGEYPSFLRHKRQGAFLTPLTHLSPSPSLPFPTQSVTSAYDISLSHSSAVHAVRVSNT